MYEASLGQTGTLRPLEVMQLVAMLLVKIIHDLSGGGDNLHGTGTVRVTAQCYRVVLEWQVDILAGDGCY